jgi:glutaminyl-peptide cyclotransferase
MMTMVRASVLVMALVTALVTLSATTKTPTPPIQIAEFRVTAIYPHDRSAFTQGLFYRDGYLYESTGIEGQSTISKVDVKTGKAVTSSPLPERLFGEGMVDWRQEIISVTWQSGVGYRWDLNTLKPTSRFTYKGEGWGMTRDGSNLILSDGTPALRFLDPMTFSERRRVNVTLGGRDLRNINELEWVKGKVFANIWRSNLIVIIDPASGTVERVLDMTPLVKASGRSSSEDVLNGIAYDANTDRLWVTGKNWPTLFELRATPQK